MRQGKEFVSPSWQRREEEEEVKWLDEWKEQEGEDVMEESETVHSEGTRGRWWWWQRTLKPTISSSTSPVSLQLNIRNKRGGFSDLFMWGRWRMRRRGQIRAYPVGRWRPLDIFSSSCPRFCRFYIWVLPSKITTDRSLSSRKQFELIPKNHGVENGSSLALDSSRKQGSAITLLKLVVRHLNKQTTWISFKKISKWSSWRKMSSSTIHSWK